MGRFDGKVVLVTGGNRNTGIEITDLFVREGAQVFMCGSGAASTAKVPDPHMGSMRWPPAAAVSGQPAASSTLAASVSLSGASVCTPSWR